MELWVFSLEWLGPFVLDGVPRLESRGKSDLPETESFCNEGEGPKLYECCEGLGVPWHGVSENSQNVCTL